MSELLNGDALKLLPTIVDRFDTCIADPPYSCAFVGKFYEVLKRYQKSISLRKKRDCNEWSWLGIPGYWSDNYYKTNAEYEDFTSAWLSEVLRILLPGGFLACFGCHKLIHVNVALAEVAGFKLKDILIWRYPPSFSKGLSLSRIGGNKKHRTITANSYEPILLLQRPPEGNNLKNFEKHGTGFIDTEVLASNVLECSKPGKKEKGDNPHYSVKPVALVETLCRGLRAKRVLDPFMGSGTVGEACRRLGLPYTGIELEPEFYTYATKRLLHSSPVSVPVSGDIGLACRE